MMNAPGNQGKRRVGVMGGTFDPIHHGHLVAASEVAHHFELDEVVFVPTGRPYQKAEREVSAPEDRYLMTVIATASNPRFSVSRVDVDRPGPTFTIDTLRDICAEVRSRRGAVLHHRSGRPRRRFSTGRTPTSCSSSRTSSAVPGPVTRCTTRACPRAR